MTRPFAVACALTWLAACETTPLEVSQTIVWVDADSEARDTIARLRFQAVGPTQESEPTVETNDPDWPVKLVIAPKNDDPTRTFTLYIEARDADGDRRMTLKFATGYVARQTRHVKLHIQARCVQSKADCPAGTVCNVWDLETEPEEFGRTAKDAHDLDVTCGLPAMPPPQAGSGGGGSGGMTSAGAGVGGVAGTSNSRTCDPGYVRSGTNCVDVDDCANGDPCGEHGECQNTAGSYTCQCDPNYETRDGTCLPVVDCQKDNGGCESGCMESGDVATCTCDEGEWLKADRKTCGGFSEPRRISSPGSMQRTQPHVAFDADGNALAVWTEAMPTQSGTPAVSLWLRAYNVERGWDGMARRVMINSGGFPSDPKVAMASNGRGLIVWTQVEEGDGDIWAARYVDQNVQEPVRIDEAGTTAGDASIALNANADGLAAWTQFDGEESQVWVNHFSPDNGWAGPRRIEIDDNGNGNGNDDMGGDPPDDSGGEAEALATRLALDADGNATVVWTQTDASSDRPVPWSARFDAASQDWETASPLDESDEAGVVDVQRWNDGHGVAVWPAEMGGAVTLLSRSHDANGDWQSAAIVAMFDSELDAVVPRASLSASGRGAVVWAQEDAPIMAVWTSRYDTARERWGAATELSEFDSQTLPRPQLAVDDNGDGFAVWTETRGMQRAIKAFRLQAERGFIGGVTISEDTTPDSASNSAVRIAVDPKGRAVVIWEVFEMGQYTVWSSAFE